MSHMSHFRIIPGTDADAAWRQYRAEYVAWAQRVREMEKELGASELLIGLYGHVIGAKFAKGQLHGRAFKLTSSRRDGFHLPRSAKAKNLDAEDVAAIKRLDELSNEAGKLFPNARTVATELGFVFGIQYEGPGVSGSSSVGTAFYPVQPLWLDESGPMYLYAADAGLAIEGLAERSLEGFTVTPPKWEVPAGHEKITEAEWNFIKAEHELKKEREGAQALG